MTTVLSPIEFNHLVQVVRHKACGHRAECWCGWASAWCDDYATAAAAAADHRDAVAGPATDLDATLSALLDLQDDLADTLIWLVENWSSELPVPQADTWVRHLDNGACVPCVRLLVGCHTSAELAALADLIAAPIVADANPHGDESCHERVTVTRRFGRVEIVAYSEGEDNAA